MRLIVYLSIGFIFVCVGEWVLIDGYINTEIPRVFWALGILFYLSLGWVYLWDWV